MWLRLVLILLLSGGGRLLAEVLGGSTLSTALSARYVLHSDWQNVVDVDVLASRNAPRYWRTIDEIHSGRTARDLPLSGLHLALDPGHVGGRWAAAEGRNFRIAEDDFYVREGELVLEVAQRVQVQLVALGARVSLLREANTQVNPKAPIDYLEQAAQDVEAPESCSLATLWEYSCSLRDLAVRLSVISGELTERARVVNEQIQPDALISLHINAAPWPISRAGVSASESEPCAHSGDAKQRLVQVNHLHALIFGCMSEKELQSEEQQAQLALKLLNGSGAIERLLGAKLVEALADATKLPAANYQGRNAILLSKEQPYLFARNLLLLREVECPTVMLEPYIANSVEVYARIQTALAARAVGAALGEDDILLEYSGAVVDAVLACYGSK